MRFVDLSCFSGSKDLMMRSVYTFFVIVVACVFLGTSCQHDADPEPEPVPPGPSNSTVVLDTLYRPVDPTTAASIGFFLNEWQPKVFVAPAASDAGQTANGDPTDTIN